MSSWKENHDRRFRETRQYNIKKVWESHQEMVRMRVLGHNEQEIAETTGYTPQQVSNVLNSPLARLRIDELESELDTDVRAIALRVRKFTPVALEVLEDIIAGKVEGCSVALRAKTAENWLARDGFGAIQKNMTLSGTISPEEISEIKARAREARNTTSPITEVPPTETSFTVLKGGKEE